ncbi:hypothetical protein ABFS83_11G073000 [Erythranthe nasuta]
MSPFELVYGQQPMVPHDVALQQIGGKCPAAYRFARARQELLDEANDSLMKAQARMKKYADAHRRDVEFQIESASYVSCEFLKKFNQDLIDESRKQTKRAPPVVRKEFEREIQQILDHKTQGQRKKNRRTELLIHWKNSDVADATWEKAVNLWQFEDELASNWENLKRVNSSMRA